MLRFDIFPDCVIMVYSIYNVDRERQKRGNIDGIKNRGLLMALLHSALKTFETICLGPSTRRLEGLEIVCQLRQKRSEIIGAGEALAVDITVRKMEEEEMGVVL